MDCREGWEHIAGGSKDGKDLPEYHVPGPAGDFTGGNGRPGGRFVDLTFRSPSGKLVHIQTVDMDKNGKATEREMNAAEDIRKREFVRGRRADVILIYKAAQMKRAK